MPEKYIRVPSLKDRKVLWARTIKPKVPTSTSKYIGRAKAVPLEQLDKAVQSDQSNQSESDRSDKPRPRKFEELDPEEQLEQLANLSAEQVLVLFNFSQAAAIDIGRKRFKGPLFIAAGTADLAVPIHIVNSVVDDTCAMLKQENWDESLEMITYADMSHFSIIQASQLQWLQWVKDRLSPASKPLRRGCVKKEMSGFLIDQPIKQAFPNFLQGWASPDEGWKYSL